MANESFSPTYYIGSFFGWGGVDGKFCRFAFILIIFKLIKGKMKEYKVLIPDETYQILNFVQDKLPGVVVVNTGLRNFEPKIVFGWHLSIIIDLEDLIENGMPSKKERDLIYEYGELLNRNIKGDKVKPNGLFLARITWNKTRQLIWRINDPEIANNFLQQIITENSSPRPFDYKMEQDIEWKFTEWYLTEYKSD